MGITSLNAITPVLANSTLNVIEATVLHLSLLFGQLSYLSDLGAQLWVYGQVALGLGFVIFVHELGHFLAAKTFGVRCDKFYVGFDVPISIGPIRLPSTLGKFQWGETEYGIGIIPLGGYVKMLGQDDDPRKAEEEAAKTRLGDGEEAPLDPRSYPAKPVWQRMIIISAGVVMNLIFAVILAGAAYWIGVRYTPTVVGDTYAGGPAWQAGIEPGDQILAIGDDAENMPKMRFDDFTTEVVLHGFESKDDDLNLVLKRGDQVLQTSVRPTPRYHPEGYHFTGLRAARTPQVANPPYSSDSYLGQISPDIRPGDRLVAVNGEPLVVNDQYGQPLGSSLIARFQANWNQAVEVTVERVGEDDSGQTAERLQVELPAVPVKTLGIGFAFDAVTAIQVDSPASEADIQVGDVIESVNGEPVGNALQLPAQVAKLAGQDVRLGLVRQQGNDPAASDTIEVVLKSDPQASFDTISPLAGELSLANLGIAFGVNPVIQELGTEATEAGLQVGDELAQIQWIVGADEQEDYSKSFTPQSFEALVIDSEFTIPCLYDWLQAVPADSVIKCTVRRDGKVQEPVDLKTQYAADWFWHQRGLAISPLMDTYKADSFVAAAQLGLSETIRRFNGVLNFLRLLGTGQIGLNGLGGPGRIAYVAASEASFGPSRLMLFLTMLSANLAILNFLPIPALDGGHMMFLTAEAIRGKPVSEALQVRLTMLGVLGLLSLMAFVIVKDIMWFAN